MRISFSLLTHSVVALVAASASGQTAGTASSEVIAPTAPDASLAVSVSVQANSPSEGTAEAAADGQKQRPDVDPADPKYYSGTGMEPRGNLAELGLFGGLNFISHHNRLNGPGGQQYSKFKRPTAEIGLRVAYFPISFLGVEAEGMIGSAETREGVGTRVYAARGHMILQYPTSTVSPFVLIGGGILGVSGTQTHGDRDPGLHFGGGLKANVHPKVSLRLEVRDTITKQRPGTPTAQHIETLVGASMVFGRPDPVPLDSDGDQVIDLNDFCPAEPGLMPDGCPIRDADKDGFLDDKDSCPNEAGVAPDGCPIRDADGDGVLDPQDECMDIPGIQPTGCPDGDNDGILDRDDRCLTEKGVAPDGCPPDSDGDGFIDKLDGCPTEPETKNGFEDTDGCPDTIPEIVKKFSGVIPGIQFASNKAVIRPGSRGILDEAAGVLSQYPSLKILVVGHTDSRGGHDHNVELSRKRADAVKAFMIERGVATDRVITRGEGPDEPIADNKTRAGRAENRRIEFRIVK